MLENESQFYWLFASALLTWLGVWFHDTHGMLTWTSGPICFLTFAIGLLSPIACIPILFCKPNRYERPLLTIVSFVAMLFWNQVPTVSFFALMLFRFRKASRTLGIAVLTGLQIAVFFLLPFFFGPSEELDHLRTAGYNLSICKVTLPVDATHVAVLVNRFSHYHRTVVDLTVKNLPIQVETIPAEK